jgi:hypothetical protein
MGVLKKAVRLIGPALLIFVFIRFVDISLLLKTFKDAALYYLFFSYILTIALFLGKIFRISLPLSKSSVDIKFYYFTRIFTSSRLLGWISNTFISDVVNAGILMTTHKQKTRISSVFILSRAADILATLILFGIMFYLNAGLMVPYLRLSYRKIVIIFSLVFAAMLLVFFLRTKVMVYMKDFLAAGKTFLAVTVNLTVFTVICTILSVVLNAKALHIDVSPSFLLLCYAVGIAISVLPISISGIGTREITFVFLMKLVDVPSEKAIAFSFLEFLFMPLLCLATLHVVALIGEYRENSHHR